MQAKIVFRKSKVMRSERSNHFEELNAEMSPTQYAETTLADVGLSEVRCRASSRNTGAGKLACSG